MHRKSWPSWVPKKWAWPSGYKPTTSMPAQPQVRCRIPNGFFFLSGGRKGSWGIVAVPVAGYSIPDAFEKNLLIAILNECGLSQERIRLQEERGKRGAITPKQPEKSPFPPPLSQEAGLLPSGGKDRIFIFFLMPRHLP